MKAILVFVTTLDGKITKWGNPDVKSWSSAGDQNYFKKLWKESFLILMGSRTYEAEPVKPSSGHLFVIMTHDPSKYKDIVTEGKLEFTSESPQGIYERFEREGHELMLVVGGPHVAASFLEAKLIDELWLTIEPKIFGTGGNFVSEVNLDIELKLLSSEKVNEQGTLINKYAVLKEQS